MRREKTLIFPFEIEGEDVTFRVQRLRDGFWYDNLDFTFKPTPVQIDVPANGGDGGEGVYYHNFDETSWVFGIV